MRRTGSKLRFSAQIIRILSDVEMARAGGGFSATLSTVYTSSAPQPIPTTETLHCVSSPGDPWPTPPTPPP